MLRRVRPVTLTGETCTSSRALQRRVPTPSPPSERVGQSFGLRKLCGCSCGEAAEHEQHEVCTRNVSRYLLGGAPCSAANASATLSKK